MNKSHLLVALLAVGIAAPAWSQEVDGSGIPAGKCDPSKGNCVSIIVFSSTRDHTDLSPLNALARLEIYRISMNEDGTANTDTLMRLTENEVGVNGFFGGNAFAKLSPDGKRIVFDSNRDRAAGEPLNTSDLFLMKANGEEQTRLTRGSAASRRAWAIAKSGWGSSKGRSSCYKASRRRGARWRPMYPGGRYMAALTWRQGRGRWRGSARPRERSRFTPPSDQCSEELPGGDAADIVIPLRPGRPTRSRCRA